MADPFKRLTSRTIVLAQENIDTDQIIPARFLTTTTREGLGAKAFYDWRFDTNGEPIAAFAFNRVDPARHRFLVAGDNFGCGSSREHAPWALIDYGVRAVISTCIADIFTANALQNGLLPIVVDKGVHEELLARPGETATVDLEACALQFGDAAPVRFSIEPFARRLLLDGVDSLGWLLKGLPAIEAYERAHASETRA